MRDDRANILDVIVEAGLTVLFVTLAGMSWLKGMISAGGVVCTVLGLLFAAITIGDLRKGLRPPTR